MQGKLTAQAEDVPRIDHRATGHRPHEQRTGDIKLIECGGALSRADALARGGALVSGCRLPQRLLRRHDAAGDPGRHPRRRGGHHPSHPLRAIRPAESCEYSRECHTLHLPRPAAGEQAIDVPPHAPERLTQTPGLVVQKLPMVLRELRHQPPVKRVAVAGDPREQVCQREAGGGRSRPMPGESRGHQNHARQHRRRLATQLRLPRWLTIGGRLDRRLGPRQDAVERGLLHDHPSIEALAVDAGGIPQTEKIVGPACRGMHEIKGPRIEGQFLQQGKVEVGLSQQLFGCLLEDRQRILDEPTVAAMRGTCSADEERHRSDTLVRIGFGQLAVLQHGHRPPADVVVEPADRFLHDAFRIVPHRIAGQNGLRCRHQEEGTFQAAGWLMFQQITVEIPVGRQQPGEEQVEHPPGLGDIPECRFGRRERLQPLRQEGGHRDCGIGPLHDRAGGDAVFARGRLDGRKQGVHCPPDGRIEGPG